MVDFYALMILIYKFLIFISDDYRIILAAMATTMELPQQQLKSQDTVDYSMYLQSGHNQKIIKSTDQYHQHHVSQKQDIRDHNASFTTTKGLLNRPGQNNCFLNSAVQVINNFYFFPT